MKSVLSKRLLSINIQFNLLTLAEKLSQRPISIENLVWSHAFDVVWKSQMSYGSFHTEVIKPQRDSQRKTTYIHLEQTQSCLYLAFPYFSFFFSCPVEVRVILPFSLSCSKSVYSKAYHWEKKRQGSWKRRDRMVSFTDWRSCQISWQYPLLSQLTVQTLPLFNFSKGSFRCATAPSTTGFSRWDLEKNNIRSILPNQYVLFSKTC